MALLSLALLLFFLLRERPDSGERFAVPDDDGVLSRETRVHPRSPLAPAVEAYRQGYVRKAIGLLKELVSKGGLRKAERLKAGNYLGYLYLARQQRAEAALVFRETLQTDSGNVPALHGLGLIAQQEGDHPSAIRHFQDALDSDAKSVKSRFHLGQSQFALGRYGDAAASWTLALREREDPRIRYELGNALLRQGRPDAAWTEFKQVLDLSPNRVLLGYASARLGDIADDRQDAAQALQHYRLAVRYYPAKFEFSFNLGVLLLKNGERDEALAVFRGILPTAPDGRVAALARTLGEIHYDAKQYGEALRYFRISLARQEDLDTAAVVADLHYLRKEYAAALVLYENIIRKYPDSQQAHAALINAGNIRLLQEEWDDALDCYQRALRKEPNNARLWYNMGILFWRQELFAKAESSFLKAAKLDPLYDEALKSAALAVIRQGDERRALNLYLGRIAARKEATPAWMYRDAGGLFRRLREYDNAANFLRRAMGMTPDRPGKVRILHELARVALDRGDIPALYGVLHEARSLQAGNPLTAYFFALGMVRDGREREAAESLNNALLYNPEPELRAEIYFQLGNLSFKRGQYGEAYRYFRRTLDLVPDHGMAQFNASVCIRELRQDPP